MRSRLSTQAGFGSDGGEIEPESTKQMKPYSHFKMAQVQMLRKDKEALKQMALKIQSQQPK